MFYVKFVYIKMFIYQNMVSVWFAKLRESVSKKLFGENLDASADIQVFNACITLKMPFSFKVLIDVIITTLSTK